MRAILGYVKHDRSEIFGVYRKRATNIGVDLAEPLHMGGSTPLSSTAVAIRGGFSSRMSIVSEKTRR